MFLILILFFPENFFFEISSSQDILDCFICFKKECYPVLDYIIPIDKENYLLFYPSERKINLFKESKKFKEFKILKKGSVRGSLGFVFIKDMDLKENDYFLRVNERGIWKLDSILPKEEKKREIKIFEREELNSDKFKGRRAVYFWDLISLNKNIIDWKEMARKLNSVSIDKIFIQIPYNIFKNEDNLWIKKRGSRFYDFLKFLIENNFEVEFLDGYKGFALELIHYRVINQINFIKKFWKSRFPSLPLPPLHLDIEPYLLRFYNNKNSEEIYNQYVGLLKKIKDQFPEIKLNLDIPCWLDKVEGGGEILENLFQLVDGITIMAYRSKVSGPGGILGVSEEEIKMAKIKNKKIYIGIETMKIPPDEVYKIFEAKDRVFQLYLSETEKENLYFLTKKPSKYGVKLIEETPSNSISLFEKKWVEIEEIIKEILFFYGNDIDGVAIHHWGSLKDKIK